MVKLWESLSAYVSDAANRFNEISKNKKLEELTGEKKEIESQIKKLQQSLNEKNNSIKQITVSGVKNTVDDKLKDLQESLSKMGDLKSNQMDEFNKNSTLIIQKMADLKKVMSVSQWKQFEKDIMKLVNKDTTDENQRAAQQCISECMSTHKPKDILTGGKRK